ncbi:MAG: hypothetical protein ACRBBQ_02045 [Cognatishimia sp.]
MELLEIPTKDDPEYDEAITTGMHAGDVFRTVLAAAKDGADLKQLLEKHAEVLAQAELALLSWLKHLEKRKMN